MELGMDLVMNLTLQPGPRAPLPSQSLLRRRISPFLRIIIVRLLLSLGV